MNSQKQLYYMNVLCRRYQDASEIQLASIIAKFEVATFTTARVIENNNANWFCDEEIDARAERLYKDQLKSLYVLLRAAKEVDPNATLRKNEYFVSLYMPIANLEIEA